MQAAPLADFARDPVGRYVSGARYVHFCARHDLWGVILWGRPTEEDAIELGRSLVIELDPPAVPHVSVIDARKLDGGEPRAFLAAERYIRRHSVKLKEAVQRLALIRPSGIGGAIVAGAYEILPKPYPVSVFEATADAFRWLERDGDGVLDDLYAAVSGTPALVRSLQAYLESRLHDPTLADAAGALGMSERSLQRKLAHARTSFQDELGRARVRVAKRLLEETDTPLTTIALDVGCGSLQHFSGLFRRLAGTTPSEWRKRRSAPAL